MKILFLIFHGVLILFGAGFYLRKYCEAQHRILFVLAFLFKISCGLLLGILYLNYFDGGDSIMYYNEAARMANFSSEFQINLWDVLLNTDPNHPIMLNSVYANQPRALLFSKLIYVLYLFAGGNIWIISVYLSLFSFIGFWTLFIVITQEKLISTTTLIIALFAWPSVAFWSSGLIKESISVGLILLIVSLIISANYKGYKVWQILIFVLLSFLLFKIKYYYAGILVPLAVSYCLHNVMLKKWPGIFKSSAKQIISFFSIFLLLLVLATNFHPNLHIQYLPGIIVDNYYLFIQKSAEGKALVFDVLKPSFLSLALHTPNALFAGLFRPNVFDVSNVWSLLAALENGLLLVLAIFQLKNYKKIGEGDVILKLTVILFCAIMAIFLTFSAPNFGTLVRYKAGFMPFLLMLIISGNPLVKWLKKTGVKTPAK